MSTALIADEFWHLAHDTSGRPLLARRTLPIGLAAALLAELLDSGCVILDAGLVSVASDGQPYDAVSSEVVGMIRDERVHPVPTWLSVIGRSAPDMLRQRLDTQRADIGPVPGDSKVSGWFGLLRRRRLSPTAIRLQQGAMARQWNTPADAVLAALAWATELDAILLRGGDAKARQFHEDSRRGLPPAMQTLATDTYRTVGNIGVSYTLL